MNEIAFGVFLIFIIIAAGVFAIQRFQHKAEKDRQDKWFTDLLANKAKIQTDTNYAHGSWYQEIDVDDDGNANHTVEAGIINIGEKALEHLTFPVYCETENVSEKEVQPWAACGEKSLPVQVKNWVNEQGRGQLVISITPALLPGERRNIRWGYRLPSIFSSGDEFYNWDVRTPFLEIGGKIQFSRSWSISDIRWDSGVKKNQAIPKVKKNAIVWKMRFPKLGQRITMRFGLSNKAKDA
ncbi:MAG: hypothetical protein JW806_03950 [Sedimentisphaerales bacterium]|nr:hypothetical protein [Sedimentisphaerales bacterium]